MHFHRFQQKSTPGKTTTTKNSPMSTSKMDASIGLWILPRAKKHATGMFFALPTARPPSSNPESDAKKETDHNVVGFFFGRG